MKMEVEVEEEVVEKEMVMVVEEVEDVQDERDNIEDEHDKNRVYKMSQINLILSEGKHF